MSPSRRPSRGPGLVSSRKSKPGFMCRSQCELSTLKLAFLFGFLSVLS